MTPNSTVLLSFTNERQARIYQALLENSGHIVYQAPTLEEIASSILRLTEEYQRPLDVALIYPRLTDTDKDTSFGPQAEELIREAYGEHTHVFAYSLLDNPGFGEPLDSGHVGNIGEFITNLEPRARR